MRHLKKTPHVEVISLDRIDTTIGWRVESERPVMDSTLGWLKEEVARKSVVEEEDVLV